MTKKEFIIGLYEIGAVKFGEFTLKSGIKSPFYLDLRNIISDNELTNGIARMLSEKAKKIQFDYITGIPYTALPVATLMAQKLNKPLIYSRKEEKSYGTKNAIIGTFEKGKKCLVIDDLITSGESIMEIAEKYQKEGIITEDFMVIIDRSKNGKSYLNDNGYKLHSLIKLEEIIEVLYQNKLITPAKMEAINQFMKKPEKQEKQAGEITLNDKSKAIVKQIKDKKTNQIIHLTAHTQKAFFDKMKIHSPEAFMIAFDPQMIRDFDHTFIQRLIAESENQKVLLMADMQYTDSRNIEDGIFQISKWADFVSAHILEGEEIIENIQKYFPDLGIFLFAKWNRKGNLMNDNYMRKTFEIGARYPDTVSGYFCEAATGNELRRIRNKISQKQWMIVSAVSTRSKTYNISTDEAIRAGADCILIYQ
jgi:uridine monophosphate synthetase